jgi:hypothetical protein
MQVVTPIKNVNKVNDGNKPLLDNHHPDASAF